MGGQDPNQFNMDQMFKNLEGNPQLDNFTNLLLNEFMEKEILYEPLKEAKQTYESFIFKCENKELLDDPSSDFYKYKM